MERGREVEERREGRLPEHEMERNMKKRRRARERERRHGECVRM